MSAEAEDRAGAYGFVRRLQISTAGAQISVRPFTFLEGTRSTRIPLLDLLFRLALKQSNPHPETKVVLSKNSDPVKTEIVSMSTVPAPGCPGALQRLP